MPNRLQLPVRARPHLPSFRPVPPVLLSLRLPLRLFLPMQSPLRRQSLPVQLPLLQLSLPMQSLLRRLPPLQRTVPPSSRLPLQGSLQLLRFPHRRSLPAMIPPLRQSPLRKTVPPLFQHLLRHLLQRIRLPPRQSLLKKDPLLRENPLRTTVPLPGCFPLRGYLQADLLPRRKSLPAGFVFPQKIRHRRADPTRLTLLRLLPLRPAGPTTLTLLRLFPLRPAGPTALTLLRLLPLRPADPTSSLLQKFPLRRAVPMTTLLLQKLLREALRTPLPTGQPPLRQFRRLSGSRPRLLNPELLNQKLLNPELSLLPVHSRLYPRRSPPPPKAASRSLPRYHTSRSSRPRFRPTPFSESSQQNVYGLLFRKPIPSGSRYLYADVPRSPPVRRPTALHNSLLHAGVLPDRILPSFQV